MKRLTKPANCERGLKHAKRGLIGSIIHSYNMLILVVGQDYQRERWRKRRIAWISMTLLMEAGVTLRTTPGITWGDLTFFRVPNRFTNTSGNPPIFRTARTRMWLSTQL